MAAIKLSILVGNLEDAIDLFTSIKVYRSTTGESGTYTEITNSATRPVLVSGRTVYTYTDTAGSVDYWYKTSYYNSSTLLESSLSDPQQGEGDPALDIVSVEELKTNYLYGLDLTDDAGNPMPDSLYEWFIRSAVTWVEMTLDIPIIPKEISDERHGYYHEDFQNYMWLRTTVYPILDVSEVKMVLPGQTTGSVFDPSWLAIQKESGEIQVIPTSIGVLVFSGAGALWPSMAGNRYIPDVFRITYTAGAEVTPLMRDVIAKVASFGPLNPLGDLLGGAGIASQALSLDGLSQSFTTTSSATMAGYGARLFQYQKEIKNVLPTMRAYYKGLRMIVV